MALADALGLADGVGNSSCVEVALAEAEALPEEDTTVPETAESVLAEQDARKEMDFLLSVCRSPWGIRGAMNLYTNAASANDVSYENLYRMAAHMGIGMLGAV